jgi:hypothetical protein
MIGDANQSPLQREKALHRPNGAAPAQGETLGMHGNHSGVLKERRVMPLTVPRALPWAGMRCPVGTPGTEGLDDRLACGEKEAPGPLPPSPRARLSQSSPRTCGPEARAPREPRRACRGGSRTAPTKPLSPGPTLPLPLFAPSRLRVSLFRLPARDPAIAIVGGSAPHCPKRAQFFRLRALRAAPAVISDSEKGDATHKQPGSRKGCYGRAEGRSCGRRRARGLEG